MQLTTFVIPQVPGLKRSKPVHGVIESVVLAKKYVTPLLLFHPFVIGTVETAYWAGWRFNPTKGALIYNAADIDPWWELGLPLTKAQRRFYLESVSSMARDVREEGVPGWKEFQASANPQLDAQGQPVLQANVSGHTVRIGMSRENAFRLSTPPELVQDMMLTRLEQELKPKSPHISKRQVESEWKLLQRALDERNAEMGAGR